MKHTIEGLSTFLKKSVSTYHAVAGICEILEAEGFTRLLESGKWTIQPGGKYFVTRNQSSVIAFTVPENGFAPAQIVASHSDSPVFKLKRTAELESAGKYVQLNVERYGGQILFTWVDRPLSVAGRVIVRNGRGYESRLVNIDRDLLMIPNVALHMNRDVNDGAKFNAQVDLVPLFGDMRAKGTFDAVIAEAAGVSVDQVAGSDLFLYTRMAPTIWGANNEYFSASRLDDLECAYTTLCGFTEAKMGKHINVYCCFDNEEVGSASRQAANSTFLEDVLVRTARALKADDEELCACLASSFMVSADNAHAVHPNHPERSDAKNRPFINEGIVVKVSANQKYTTDGATDAIFTDICERAGVPVQHFFNRSDMIGGSTLGNISSAHVSIPSVDIGLPQLAMHSSYETAGVKDADYMADGLKAFFEAEIRAVGDTAYELD